MAEIFQFILTYIIVPLIVATGIISGIRQKNLNREGMMTMAKGILYAYYAIVNFIYYAINQSVYRYVIGYTIALAIIEGITSFYAGIQKCKENAKNKKR